MILYPKRVRAGSKVAIVAPSATFSTEELAAGLDLVRESGLEPVIGPCVKNLKTVGLYRSASPQERAEELNWAFSNPNITAVIAVRGGEGAAAVLPYLDFDVIKKSQKPFLGKSDNTSISMGLLAKSGLASINGRGCGVRCNKGNDIFESDCESFKLALDLMMSDMPWGTKPLKVNQHFARTVCPGRARGVAIGGNSDTFSRLIGTDYMPPVENAILFLEDVDETVYSLSRIFLHLKLTGILSRISGVVLGEFVDSDSERKHKHKFEEVIKEYFDCGPPCMYGVSFSHGAYTCPIPMGAVCTIDADRGALNFEFQMQPAVRSI